MVQPLLFTKLFIPQISDNHILRKAQLKKLRAGLERNNQLSLVCAPAGYGKITLVLEFLQAVDENTAWVSLDDGDNDPQRFLLYLTAALKNSGMEIGKDVETLITDIGFSKSDTVLTMLINSIANLKDKVILVLDDYHLIRSPKINEIIKFLLDHQPINLHLVILSREDPKLPLASLRMRDKLTEIRLGELLFSYEEASEFFHSAIGRKISNQDVEKVTMRTEGWIAGLQLAALLLKNYSEAQMEDFFHKFDGTNSYIIDYLVEEVLDHQDQKIRDFLCRTSVLERMNDELCNELTNRLDSKEVLIQLEKKNLFLISLDDKKEWYRYHHLFADSLKTSLSKEEERNLYKLTSVWMKKNGFSNEAVRYAFKSKDLELAIKMVEDSVLETFQTAQLDSLVEWMENLPVDMIKNNEVLSVRKGIALIIVGRITEAIQYLNYLDQEFERKASSHNKGLLFMARAMLANIDGKDAENLAKEALKYLEPWDPIAITSTLNSLGRAQYRKGNVADAVLTFQGAFEAGLKLGYQFITTLALMNYSLCLHTIEQNEMAIALCNQYMEEMKKVYHKLPPYIGVLYISMAELYLHNNEVDKARYYKEEGLALCNMISFDGEASLKMYKDFGSKNNLREAAKNTLTAGINSETVNSKKIGILDYNEKLSEREAEILELIGKGLSNQEIANTLFISKNTTQWHISHIYTKLGVKNRTQSILRAKEFGIL